MAKFVRWLGAFGETRRVHTLSESARWEVSNTSRQVAVEPLIKGKSLIRHVLIGLVIDHEQSQFVKGFINDAYTIIEKDGTLKNTRFKAYRNIDRYLKAVNQKNDFWHGEAVFDIPKYSAVVFDRTNCHSGRIAPIQEKAKKLANELGLKLVII